MDILNVGVRIRMNGQGRWMDNVFIERLWRSLKYEEVYLKAYETVTGARLGVLRGSGGHCPVAFRLIPYLRRMRVLRQRPRHVPAQPLFSLDH